MPHTEVEFKERHTRTVSPGETGQTHETT